MRAIRIHGTGGPEALRLEEIAVPVPRAGEALVRVEAAGVNFIDTYKRKGLYGMPLPATLGEEGAGTVMAVGDDVRTVRPGARVAWASATGSYADHVVVPVARLVPVPDGVGAREAAAMMLQGMTAHYLATSTFALAPGHRALVHAAAGGVGALLVQLARRRGAWVVGTAGTEEKAAIARAAGADAVILYTQQDFVAETKRLVGDRALDVIYDSVGRATFLAGLDLLRPRGMMVLFGQSSGPVEALDPQVLNQKGSLFLTRPTLGHYTLTREELLARAHDVFSWVAAGELTVRIDSEYPLDAAADAHRALEGRRTAGKVLLIP